LTTSETRTALSLSGVCASPYLSCIPRTTPEDPASASYQQQHLPHFPECPSLDVLRNSTSHPSRSHRLLHSRASLCNFPLSDVASSNLRPLPQAHPPRLSFRRPPRASQMSPRCITSCSKAHSRVCLTRRAKVLVSRSMSHQVGRCSARCGLRTVALGMLRRPLLSSVSQPPLQAE
jgi:hypothetical protein